MTPKKTTKPSAKSSGNGSDIQEGMVVSMGYTLKDDAGKKLDEADAKSPFVYLHGGGQIVPGLESALTGLKAGDKKSVTVSPADGYGVPDPKLLLTVTRTQFPQGMKIEEGMQFEANAGDGEGMLFTVHKIQGDQVTIDGNHPMAGKTLHFQVEILEVRAATDEEMAHGHAHGPDGHHH